MAAVYSLVCWGGLTGKTVTLTIASPCVVTSTNHGLHNGTGVVFNTTGALPTGITSGTTYYARSTAANTFNLYDTPANAIAGGATGRVATTGTQSGTHTLKSAYFLGLPDLTRWGTSGPERIYDSVVSWRAARSTANAFDEEICEIGQDFDDKFTSDLTINIPAAVIRITPTVAGVYTSAWHGGVYGAGYRLVKGYSYGAGLGFGTSRVTVEDITIYGDNYWGDIVTIRSVMGTFQRNFVYASSASINGLNIGGAANKTLNNVIIGIGLGINIYGYEHAAGTCANNTIVACNTGIKAANAYCYGWFYNNVSVGCYIENWNGTFANMKAAYNTGESTKGVPFGTNAIVSATPDNTTFVDYAGRDLRPAAGSVLIDAGTFVFDIAAEDLNLAERPNYNNGGAELWDVGAFEYDHGYTRPASTTVTFTGVNSGTEIRVYDKVTGTELAGIESCATDQALTWDLSGNDTTIRLVNTAYKIKDFDYTPVVGNQSLPIQQEPDKWYSNPI